MQENYEVKREKNFTSMWRLYFMIAFCTGILPVNIGNLLLYLPETTKFGIGVAMACHLAVSMICMLIFGYFGEKIIETKRISRKTIFIITNLIWAIAYSLIFLSNNYYSYLILVIIAAIGTGAFLPIGFSIIGDSFPPKERGKKFGFMQFGLIIGSGAGIIVGGLLGNYAGPNGWRFAYGIGGVLGLLTVYGYISSGIDPERGRIEPEFEDFPHLINYDYKITFNNFVQLLKRKSISAILIYLICAGIANGTLGIWAIFYLRTKINDVNAGLITTTIYLLAGAGALPGTILGGKFGDAFYKAGKLKGRVLLSMGGIILGVLCFLGFYLIPFYTATPLQIIFSGIFFISIGFLGFFFTSFCAGNIYAIYSEVCAPELRSTVNALNGLMVNIGGIIGNLLFSSLIERDLSLLPFAISLVLLIWLFSTTFWIIPYIFYPKESMELRYTMAERRKELEKKFTKNKTNQRV